MDAETYSGYHWGDARVVMGDQGVPVTPADAVDDLARFAQQEWGGATPDFIAGVCLMAYWGTDVPVEETARMHGEAVGKILVAFRDWQSNNDRSVVIPSGVADPVAFSRLTLLAEYLNEHEETCPPHAYLDILRGAAYAAYFFHGIPQRVPDRIHIRSRFGVVV